MDNTAKLKDLTKGGVKMARLRLTGFCGYWKKGEWIEFKEIIKCEHRESARSGSIETRFINKAKIKELEEYGYAYVNKPIEFMV